MKFINSPYQNYGISISKKSQKFIEDLSKKEQINIISKIDKLISDDYKSLDIKRLQGFNNLYRIKAGDYRIVFRPIENKKIILIAIIGHHKEIYNTIKYLTH